MDEITVKSTGLFYKYKKINDALADISDGGTIYVEEGIYYEDIVCHQKQVTIIGKGKVTFQQKGPFAAMTIRKSNITLNNVTLQQTGHSNVIYVADQSNVQIEKCHIIGEKTPKSEDVTYPAIYIFPQCEVVIKNSHVQAQTTHTIFASGGYVRVEDCTLSGFGIHATDQSIIHVKQLNMQHPRTAGIYVVDSELDVDRFTIEGGGIAIQSIRSNAMIQHLHTNEAYRDALRIEGGTLQMKDSHIMRCGDIYRHDRKKSYASIEVSQEAEVRLENVQIDQPVTDGILVNHSILTCENIQINECRIGINAVKEAKVILLHSTIEKSMYNALNIKDSFLHVADCTFLSCVQVKGKTKYPVIFASDMVEVNVKRTNIESTDHDAVFIHNTKDVIVNDLTCKNVYIGLFFRNVQGKMDDITVTDAKGSAIVCEQSVLKVNHLYVKDCLQEKEISSQLYAEKVAGAVAIFQSEVMMQKIEIVDQTLALLVYENSQVEVEVAQIAGGIFTLFSRAKIVACSRHPEEQAAIPIRLGGGAYLDIEFTDPMIPVIMNKDPESMLRSNLFSEPQTVAQVDVDDQANEKDDTWEMSDSLGEQSSNVIPFETFLHKYTQTEKADAICQSMEQWLYRMAIRSIQLQQKLETSSKHGVILIGDKEDRDKQLECLLTAMKKNDWFDPTQIVYMEEGDATTKELDEGQIVIVDPLSLRNNIVSVSEKNVGFILVGTEAEIITTLQQTPNLALFIDQYLMLSGNVIEMEIQCILSSLKAQQFQVDEAELRAVMEEIDGKVSSAPSKTFWRKFVYTVQQVQAERLLQTIHTTSTKEEWMQLHERDLTNAWKRL